MTTLAVSSAATDARLKKVRIVIAVILQKYIIAPGAIVTIDNYSIDTKNL